MTLRTRLSISLLAIFCCGAGAQTADDFFHSGAQSYLTNNVPFALQRVEEGLKRFPNDEKLKKLEELLKKQQQQQQQQSKSDQNKDQKQDQKKDSDQQKQQNDQEQKQQSKQDQDKKDKEDQSKPDQQQQPKSDDQKKDQQPDSDQQQKFAPGEMTPQQAQQLLDAQKDSEMMLPVKPQENVQPRGTLRDW